MVISDGEFQHIVTYMKTHYGIDLSKKRTLIEGRLSFFLVRNNYDNYEAFMRDVEQDVSGHKGEELVNILTTNHTYFMREPEHFEFMKEVVIPQLKSSVRDRELRVWSAASSTGEEPYTLGMLLLDGFSLEGQAWDTSLLATDISTKVLKTAMDGIYPEEAMEALPEQWKRHYFTKLQDGRYQVTKQLRDEVIFRQFNLMDPLPWKKKFHVIFLRNVMIYFQNETKRQLIERLCDFLEPGGYLFVGTAESVDKSIKRLNYVSPSVYRRVEGGR